LGENAWRSAQAKAQWLLKDLATSAKLSLNMAFDD
jgi:hypothetical protein